MELNIDNYCDDCWPIVCKEYEEARAKTKTNTLKSDGPQKTSSSRLTVSKDNESPTGAVSAKSVTVIKESSGKQQGVEASVFSPKSVVDSQYSVKATVGKTLTANEYQKTGGATRTVVSTVSYKSSYSYSSSYSKYYPGTNTRTSSPASLQPDRSISQFLHGARPNDSDLCLDCLVLEHHDSFDKNILQNVYGTSQYPHDCRMVRVQKRGHRKYMQVCSDPDCPRFRSWKIVDAGGAGWKVDPSFVGCFPPPLTGVSSCFMTSHGLCSKEQLIELAQVGLSPHIMDEVRPDIEVSEWFCGRGDSNSRYGFKVSLLDSRQLMMYVYGECKALKPPESSRWRRVSYTFSNYEPGVRYVLFHHGGTGEFTRSEAHPGGSYPDGSHPGSKMAGASILARLSSNWR